MFFKDQAVKTDKQKHHHWPEVGEIRKNDKPGSKSGSGKIPDHQQTAADQNAGQHRQSNISADRQAPRTTL